MPIQLDYVEWVESVQMDMYVKVDIFINHLLNMIIFPLMKFQMLCLLCLFVILLKVGLKLNII